MRDSSCAQARKTSWHYALAGLESGLELSKSQATDLQNLIGGGMALLSGGLRVGGADVPGWARGFVVVLIFASRQMEDRVRALVSFRHFSKISPLRNRGE